jgi:hypothetical protein
MTGAMRDAAEGQWFPPEFTYSPRTGTKLQVTVAPFDSTWVPPYGAVPLVDLAFERDASHGLATSGALG